jgi:hypothetical protein
MTGFVFTFSLFCTALLQSDAVMLQHVDLVPMRQIIDAVLPEAGHRTLNPGRHTLVPPLSLQRTPSVHAAITSTRRGDGSDGPAVSLSRVLRARPIRAPSAV